MFSLYFNCRITKESVTLGKPALSFYFPVQYPKKIESNAISQYKVLVATIKSYSIFKFDTVIFNIAIDSINSGIEEELRNMIVNSYSANNLLVNFSRPSTVEGWLKDVREVSSLIKKNSPVIVVMNHDHPFIDYTQNVFNVLVEKIFPKSNDNFGKTLYYSHAPEVISWAVNGRIDTKFTKQPDGVFKSDVVDHWIDSICVMTMETLEHIWMRTKDDGAYIGRFDWPGVACSRLRITIYVFPREFFKHFDGYGHVTGIRLISEFNSDISPALRFPDGENISDLAHFYYQRWLDCFLISVRDKLRARNIFLTSTKSFFINAIEDSLHLFKKGYLEADVTSGLLREDHISAVEATLRSHVYYMGNSLYDAIKTDIDLLDGDELHALKKYILYFLKMKNILYFLKKMIKKIAAYKITVR